jgi:hypothetical protein
MAIIQLVKETPKLATTYLSVPKTVRNQRLELQRSDNE